MSPAGDATIRRTVNRLLTQDGDLDPTLRDAIVAFGPAAVGPLLDVADRYEREIVEGTPPNWGPLHAIELLETWPAAVDVDRTIALFRRTRFPDAMRDKVGFLLEKLGARVVDPLLALYAREPRNRGYYASILARCGVRDPRIFDLLVRRMAKDPSAAPELEELGTYGDPRAIPLLSERFDAVAPGTPDEHRQLHSIARTLWECEGTLTLAQQNRMTAVEELEHHEWLEGVRRANERALAEIAHIEAIRAAQRAIGEEPDPVSAFVRPPPEPPPPRRRRARRR